MAKKNLIIASMNPELFTTKRLLSEALKLKYSPIYLNPYQYQLPLKKISLEGRYFHRTTGTNYDDFDLVVTKHHEMCGMRITNPLESLKTFRTKDLQSLFFLEHKLPAIKTLLFRGSVNESIDNALKSLSPDGKYILKMIRGNQGIGVNFLQGHKSLLSVLETFHAMKDQKFLVQPFVAHKKEWRILIIKDEIIACIEKNISKDDFRGNAKRSNAKILKKIPKDLAQLAMKAFNKCGLEYVGIDILETDDGVYMILEINPIPGFEQAEELSRINIARLMIEKL